MRRIDDVMMREMRIRMICPAPRGTLYGNRISATRWAKILRSLGHRVEVATAYDGEPCDVLVALHAKKSAGAVSDFHRAHPEKPVIVALTGTDLYGDIHRYRAAQRTLEVATRLVTLQGLASDELAPHLRGKVRVIHQSVAKTAGRVARPGGNFLICVVGHLRPVKDPFRAAMAVRDVPEWSRIQVVHAGAAMTPEMAARAQTEEKRNRRYRWVGEAPRRQVRRLIASSHLLVLSSRMEGGANVISEAIVDHTPVIASRIPGSVGLLGAAYPGFYPYGDTTALRKLLQRAEEDTAFYDKLAKWCKKLTPLFRPERERSAWQKLLNELL